MSPGPFDCLQAGAQDRLRRGDEKGGVTVRIRAMPADPEAPAGFG
jgi:hypothetical protein